ncbi:MAG: SUMF1/EgtB/PvdO family nonheme iron enzyme [Gemmatimonadetes bacterium]|nr:SUMF1/EgtB/PvdO family nonheme iron enzyme [Gemmatimonadota bacterium]NNM07515.1 SUMF1/EgtB/PvdO family nonheme iron enzyme [Gemmatimonadota bacterium]
MKKQKGKRTVWGILGIYVVGSWICLQVVDVLGQNLPLPSWAFSLTLVLLVLGAPVTAATAYLQSRRQEDPGTDGPASGLDHKFFTWRTVLLGGIGALAIWGVAVTGWLLVGADQPTEGEILAAVDQIDSLTAGSHFSQAYELVEDLDGRIRDDSVRADLWARVSQPVTIETNPEGALVRRRDFAPAGAEWVDLGRTPLTVERYPFGQARVRFELEGYTSREFAWLPGELAAQGPVDLLPEGSLPPGMVPVRGEAGSEGYGLFVPGLEQVENLSLGEFLMAETEVTNREYALFVQAGGYTDPSCWEHPFVENGIQLSFDEAMAQFTDATGRPGPASWDAGTYPPETGDFPIGGVSWYEAAAYACFTGKSLPTVYHWYAAANPFSSHHVVPLSNYGNGPDPVRENEGVSRDGIYDLAGNVREWVQNANGESRFILGGGWSDQQYAFNDAVTAPAFDRSPLNGIRLVQYLDSTNVMAAGAPLELAFRDYQAETPVSDEVFEAFRQAYSYDDTPLNARVVSSDTTDSWIRERIDMDAGYGGETLTTFLFIPKGSNGPHQTVVYFPGSGVIYRRSFADVNAGAFEFLLRSGRAVAFPVFKGTFERGTELGSDIQDESNLWRDHMIAWATDLRRTVDYLEARDEFDLDRLGYLGISWGGAVAPVMLALENRIRASVIIVGGLLMQKAQGMADPFHFLPRVSQPTVMINARFDSFYPLETSGRPLFDNLGTPEDQRKLVVIDANHGVLSYARNQVVGEALSWFDQYLGPVR